MNRRDLMKLGLGGVVGAVATQDITAQVKSTRIVTPEVTTQHDFMLRPGVTSRFRRETNQILSTTTWAVLPQFEQNVPALLSTASPSIEELEVWARKSGGGGAVRTSPKSEGLETFDALMNTPFSGAADMVDIAGSLAVAVTERQKLNVALNFLHPDAYEYSPEFDVYSSSGLPTIQGTGESQLQLERGTKSTSGEIPLAAAAPPSIQLQGWKLQFRAPHSHSLGSCVRQSVNHFHVELFRARGGGRYDYVSNFHLGTYRSGSQRCFVLWNNYYPSVCWKTCSPTRNDLVKMFKWMLAAAAIVAGVVIAAWVIAVIAEAAAAALFIPLLLLA